MFLGPYTVFVPTDRAFKTLLVQLGGPDRAEEKFRENPRLLSGVSTVSNRFGAKISSHDAMLTSQTY